jgi:type VI secretion system secreted protein VgrG
MADLVLENRMVRMKGPLPENRMFLKCAQVEEGLSQLTRTTVEFLSPDRALDLAQVVGKPISVSVQKEDEKWRDFHGTCVEVRYVGLYQGLGHYVAEVRPWLWFLTRKRNNRIFQDMTAPDIIMKVLSDAGFSADTTNALSQSRTKREYCVQYGETDFDFIARLMEEEGIYFFFNHDQAKEKLVLADGIGAHSAVPGHAMVDFHFREPEYRRRADHVFEWTGAEQVTSGKVSLDDYDFKSPSAALGATRAMAKGSHEHNKYEVYDYPGALFYPGPEKPDDRFAAGLGDHFARVKMEALAIAHKRWRGVGNVRAFAAGNFFTLQKHPRNKDNGEYLIVSATHQLQIETDYEDDESLRPLLGGRLDFGSANKDTYRCTFEVVPKADQYRAPQTTCRAQIPGLQTAVVVGPAGEEIYTDKFGRIRIQFFWDREGKKDENSTCWARVMQPWTGKNWGMIGIPRIGQEVVVQFEQGNPDRPIIMGMLYNAETMPPYALPDNQTMSGIKTDKSKGGGGFNELVMEDKAGAEYVRLQSERDYKEIIKNDAVITIGLEHKDKGDLTQTIHRNKTETLKTGDHTFKVEAGNQTIEIKKNKSEKIEGKSDLTITGNLTETISQGNHSETVSLGNYSLKTSAGKVTVEAMQSIELKVMGSSIKIDPVGVTIKGPIIKIEGTGMVQLKAPMSQLEGSALMIVKGGLTMIN